jgi:ABC-type lipoprotein release transport system permease subunit
MPAPLNNNRAMFWRILRRLLFAHRGRLFVILLALAAGASITAALLNLQVDAKRRLTTEFRALGANVIIAPHDSGESTATPRFLDDSVLKKVLEGQNSSAIAGAEFLYGVVDVGKQPNLANEQSAKSAKAILVGYLYSGARPEQVVPAALLDAERKLFRPTLQPCEVGQRVAAAVQLQSGDGVALANGGRKVSCHAFVLPTTGGQEDSQVFMELPTAQALLEQSGHISLIQLSVPGTPQEIQTYISHLQSKFPEAEIRPIRQFTEGEAKIYNRISGVLTATVIVVLVLSSLCVMAAMTNVAMERRNDVGLMKAIGGASRRVLRLFLMEAALLGLAGGLLGAAAGIGLSIWLGKAVFGLAARPRLIVYPVAVALTILVSIAGAFPLRRLVSIRPASVFRGEA